jgi:protein CpxP
MKNKFLAIAGATILAAGLTFAQTETAPAPNSPAAHAHGGFHGRPMFARMAHRLNLTDAQREQAKGIFQDMRTQAKPIRAQLQAGRQALVSAAVAGKSTDELSQLAQAQGPQLAQLAVLRAQALGKFYAILTPGQQQQFQTMQAKRAAHAGGQAEN